MQSQWENIPQHTAEELIHVSETTCGCAMKPLTQTASPSCSAEGSKMAAQMRSNIFSATLFPPTFEHLPCLADNSDRTILANCEMKHIVRSSERKDEESRHACPKRKSSMRSGEWKAIYFYVETWNSCNDTEGFFFSLVFFFQNKDIHIKKRNHSLYSSPQPSSHYFVLVHSGSSQRSRLFDTLLSNVPFFSIPPGVVPRHFQV